MRVTENMRVGNAVRAQSRAAERLLALTRTAATGLRVSAPADDPTAFSSAVRKDADLAVLSARSRAAVRAESDLEIAESTLTAAGEAMMSAREIAVRMASGSIDAKTRADAAKQIDSLRASLIAIGNTKGAAGYVFAGNKTDVPPFSSAGAFVGDDGTHEVEIGKGVTVTVNASGARAFTKAGGRDILADLAALSTALSTNDVPNITKSIDAIDFGHRQIIAARTDVGVTLERLRSSIDVMQSSLSLVKSARAKDVEGDAIEVLSELMSAKSAYERSIEITRQILALSSVGR